jgi:c-di-GMP-binding flagellar brake protein YcgR
MKERHAFRVSVVPRVPVRFTLVMEDGTRIAPVVDELAIGGARLMSVKYFDRFYEGQVLDPGALPLEDFGTISVAAVVKWKTFPEIGIEFVNMTDRDRERLFRYLFKVSRQAIRFQRDKKGHGPRLVQPLPTK